MNILVVGSISFDEIMNFPGQFLDYFHPDKLHQINVSFVVDKLEKQLGGTGTNIAYNIMLIFNNKLLNENNKVKILSAVGKDGKIFIDFFNKNKIDTKNIIIDKSYYSSAGKVITDIKDNQIWGFYYGASNKANKINLKNLFSINDLLVISAIHKDAFLHFQNQAIDLNIPYVYDPGMALTWIKDKDLEKGVLNCKYLVGNDYEIAMITKRLKKTISELTNRGLNVITTLGEKGVSYEAKSKNFKNIKIEIPAYKVKKVIDPTGAGDAWRGGFTAALSLGMNLNECLKMGNVLASFAVEVYGTVNHKPNYQDIIKRLNNI